MDVPAAPLVVELALSRPPLLAGRRLVCVDGPAGSGKTTLAAALEGLLPHAVVVHTDELLAGWDGLDGLPATLATMLTEMADGAPGAYRRYDWVAGSWAETVTLPPHETLVLEGVGSASLPGRHLSSAVVWVEAPHDLRMRRGIERDGDDFAPYWERWALQEAALHEQHATRGSADVLVDAVGRARGAQAPPSRR